MKPIVLLLFLLCCSHLTQAQADHCDKFSTLLDKANSLWAQKKFEDAFAKLSAAREACPGKAAEVDNQYALFIRDIANKYETADVKTREAKREAERAKNATDLAEKNAARSDSIARRAYADDLAYKSTIALRDGDRTAAFRLAEFAHRYVDDDNLNVTNALVQAIYYNEDPKHTFLPWASNLEGHTSSVLSVAFSPDGKKLATGSHDETTKIWDVVSGKDMMTLHTRNTLASDVVFSPDGKKLATSSEDRTAKIWDLTSGKSILTLSGHNSYVKRMAFSPDGKKLATGSDDGTAKIWDLASGKDILTLSGNRYSISSISLSPDGKKLATCSDDENTKIWDIRSGKDILTLSSSHIAVVRAVAFSPDGKKLATGSYDKTAKILELTPEGWMHSAGKNRQLAGLTFQQLDAYNLSGLLDIRPENEEVLKRNKDSRQINAFAELSAQNTRNSRDLRRTASDFGRAARLYGYAFDNSGDSALLVKLGDLYLRWAEDILASNRPDTAARYIDVACRLYMDKYQCPKLWDVYAQKTGTSVNFDQFIASERADELKDYGNYFFVTEKWTEARQLYEKAASRQHSAAVLINLFIISEKTKETFDTQRFWALENPGDLGRCAIFFVQKADQLEKFKDQIPYYQNALQLREKQIKLDSTIALRVAMANEYNNIGFLHLFVPDGKAAESNIRRAIELDPANKFTHTNLAPALLLQGKYKEAEAAYKHWAPLPFNELNLATYRDAFLGDLKAMEEQGVQGFDFARVRVWLEEKH